MIAYNKSLMPTPLTRLRYARCVKGTLTSLGETELNRYAAKLTYHNAYIY